MTRPDIPVEEDLHMGYFDDEDNVREYIRMADGYDGRDLVDILRLHLAPGSTVLEVGKGPGKDLDILRETFVATGSDSSRVFLDLYGEGREGVDLLLLDARTLESDKTFDCIYSNKVLIHLSRDDLRTSLSRQRELLNEGGILFHTFWEGDGEEEMDGLHFTYYTRSQLLEIARDYFDVIEVEQYGELEEDDSIYVILKKGS